MIQLDNITVSYKGDHTGLGSVVFNEIAIVSMGPHYFPLGEASRFGIYREGEDFSDVERKENSVSGWTKLIAGDRAYGSGATWVLFSAEKKGKETLLTASFENSEKEDPFAFVFFVRAEEVRAGGKQYAKGGLQRFEGDLSEVELLHKNERIILQSSKTARSEIIPLSGDDSFWGADFLISFAITHPELKYSWTLRDDSDSNKISENQRKKTGSGANNQKKNTYDV